MEIETIRQVPIFQDLTQEELERIWDITIKRSYPKKSVIFTEGSPKEAVFFIQEGVIKTTKTDENGHDYIVSILKPGDMFPHVGFFNDHPYPATAEAIIDSILLAIPVHSFEQMIMSTPSISIKVMRVLGSKIMDLQEKLQNLTGQDVQFRFLVFIRKVIQNYGTPIDGKIHIDLPMTHQEIANAIGTSRETVNRIMNQLKKERIVEPKRNGMIITDYEALQTWTHK